MRIRQYCTLLLVLSSIFTLQGQDSRGYYMVEMDKFSPPIRDMVKSYEGFPATPFLAKDMSGVERYLGHFKGKICLLAFLNFDEQSTSLVAEDFNRVMQFFGEEELSIVAFADQSRDEMRQIMSDQIMDFIIIPNGRLFGEAAYSLDLGYPRLFIIDAFGVIQKVLPEEAITMSSDRFEMIRAHLEKVLNQKAD